MSSAVEASMADVLSAVAGELSGDQLTEAKRLVSEWKPKTPPQPQK